MNAISSNTLKLLEADGNGSLAEALSAHHEVVLADETTTVSADTAAGKNLNPFPSTHS